MPLLTLGWLTLIGATPLEIVIAAAAADFHSVSLRITGRRLTDKDASIVGDRRALSELKSRLNDEGIHLSNTSVYHISPGITLDHLRPAIDASAELGASIMSVTCLDPDHERFAEFMNKLSETAGNSRMKIALEFTPYSDAKTLPAADSIVRRSRASNFGLLIDALHLSRSGGLPSDIRGVDPDRIFLAQLCDAKRAPPSPEALAVEARTGRLYPGQGELDLYNFLEALPLDIEIECECPMLANSDRSPVEQAKRAGDAVRSFLNGYSARRSRSYWN